VSNPEQYWAQINVPDSVAEKTVHQTVPHSTMGNMIVGDYDVEGADNKFNAFICVFERNASGDQVLGYKQFSFPGAKLVTAYGVWQNGSDSTSYTIAGGLNYDGSGVLNYGFLVNVDYDPKTGTIVVGIPMTFNFNNNASIPTHFEGITELATGSLCFSLAAMSTEGAAFAVVKRNNGSFGNAPQWIPAQCGTGNTVLTNKLFGVYPISGGDQSYMETFPGATCPP